MVGDSDDPAASHRSLGDTNPQNALVRSAWEMLLKMAPYFG
jgi:hypothetical protein